MWAGRVILQEGSTLCVDDFVGRQCGLTRRLSSNSNSPSWARLLIFSVFFFFYGGGHVEFCVVYVCVQEMRTYKEAEAAGKAVGFDLVSSYDVATASPVAGPWCASSPQQPSKKEKFETVLSRGFYRRCVRAEQGGKGADNGQNCIEMQSDQAEDYPKV
jgi:hypothetical protein